MGMKRVRRKPMIKNISLKPTWELGYFCGLVIGDGCLHKQKSKNYRIQFCTTKKDFIDLVVKAARAVDQKLKPLFYKGEVNRRLPNRVLRTDRMFYVWFDSKILYDALRPYKQPDYRWGVPKFLNTRESRAGFIGGLFDADGWVGDNRAELYSKHRDNLLQVSPLLLEFGIKHSVYGPYLHKDGHKLAQIHIPYVGELTKLKGRGAD